MKILKLISTAAATTLLGVAMSTSASAADVTFGSPAKFKGTGCPGKSTVEVVGENTPTLSVLFGQFDAGNGKPSLSGLGRSACSFAIPVNVLRGFQVSHVTVDWETFTQGSGQLKRKFFLSGQPWSNKWQATNLGNGNRTVRDDLLHASLATGCNGGRFNIRINSQITANSGSYSAVDSVDLNNRIIFKVKFKKC